MKVVKSASLLRAIKEAQPKWFSRGNKRFFGDVAYSAYYGKATGRPYLVQTTNAWTNMFGGEKMLHYRINAIHSDTKRIVGLLDREFCSIYEVMDWLVRA